MVSTPTCTRAPTPPPSSFLSFSYYSIFYFYYYFYCWKIIQVTRQRGIDATQPLHGLNKNSMRSIQSQLCNAKENERFAKNEERNHNNINNTNRFRLFAAIFACLSRVHYSPFGTWLAMKRWLLPKKHIKCRVCVGVFGCSSVRLTHIATTDYDSAYRNIVWCLVTVIDLEIWMKTTLQQQIDDSVCEKNWSAPLIAGRQHTIEKPIFRGTDFGYISFTV